MSKRVGDDFDGPWPPTLPVAQLSPTDYFTLQDAKNGVNVLGSTGAGKTSATGALLASSYLRAGMGFLVMAAKADEVSLWERYAADNGRANSLIVFDKTQRFNFLEYSLRRYGPEGIGSVIDDLMMVVEIARGSSPQPGGVSDQFWQDSVRQLLNYSIPLLWAANGSVTIRSILDFIHAAPVSGAQYDDKERIKDNLAYQTLSRARTNPQVSVDQETIDRLIRYWLNQFTALPEKTRGNMIASIDSVLDRFNHGWLRKVFCTDTTIAPDMCMHGAVIVLGFPVLTHGVDGIIAQQLFKYLWQRTMESRNGLPPSFRHRPVCLFADEAGTNDRYRFDR